MVNPKAYLLPSKDPNTVLWRRESSNLHGTFKGELIPHAHLLNFRDPVANTARYYNRKGSKKPFTRVTSIKTVIEYNGAGFRTYRKLRFRVTYGS
jgi:hypothetical protein